jgi:uncharacterized protein
MRHLLFSVFVSLVCFTKPAAGSALICLSSSAEPVAQTVYIFGTVHLYFANKTRITSEVKNALLQSQQLLLESGSGNVVSDRVIPKEKGRTIYAHFPKSLIESIEQLNQKKGIVSVELNLKEVDIALLRHQILAQAFFLERLKLILRQKLLPQDDEKELLLLAKQQQITVRDLEDAETVIQVFAKIPIEEIVYDLEKIITALTVDKVARESLLKEDLSLFSVLAKPEPSRAFYEQMYSASNAITRHLPSWLKFVLNERTKNFAEAINGYRFENGPIFVAVGSAHLSGPEGLIEILKRDGYRECSR